KAARSFFEILAREVEVSGTDEADTLQVLRQRDGAVEVVLAAEGGVYFRRRLDPATTREVRVFLKGGDDRAITEGSGDSSIVVRGVGGDGDDSIDDSAGGHPRFYDSSGENEVVRGPGTRVDTRPYTHPLDWGDDPVRDWGKDHHLWPWLRAGDGYGVLLGATG